MKNSKIFTLKNGLIAVIVLYVINLLTKNNSLQKEPFLTTISNAENQLSNLKSSPVQEPAQIFIGQIQPQTTEIPSLIPINALNDDILFVNQNPIA